MAASFSGRRKSPDSLPRPGVSLQTCTRETPGNGSYPLAGRPFPDGQKRQGETFERARDVAYLPHPHQDNYAAAYIRDKSRAGR